MQILNECKCPRPVSLCAWEPKMDGVAISAEMICMCRKIAEKHSKKNKKDKKDSKKVSKGKKH